MRRAMARRNRRPLWRRPALGQRGRPVEEFAVIPSDLRATDPSFADELRSGYLGFGGTSVAVGETSPFALAGAPVSWQSELHSFRWLNHLTAAQTSFARDTARAYVHDWITRTAKDDLIAWRADVMARRVIAWVNHAPLILDAAEPAEFDRVMESLHRQLVRLGHTCTAAGPARLEGLMALVLADLAIKDQEAHLVRAERELVSELQRHILDDGGHISRNPERALELLLDLLPLRQTYSGRGLDLPDGLNDTIERMVAFLAHMRLGDGRLAAFNGAGRRRLDELSTVLLYATGAKPRPGLVAASRYLRAEAGAVTLIMDCGSAPPIEHAGDAGAGCLAFELSDGTAPLFANPGPGVGQGSAARGILPWRATTAHSTLTLAEQSSARFIQIPAGTASLGQIGLTGPRTVTATSSATAEGHTIEAMHDGFLASFELAHTRTISLAPDGNRISGHDRLNGKSGVLRLKQDVPVAVHFHLHPGAGAAQGDDGSVEITLPGGRHWRFKTDGAEVRVETTRIDSARLSQQIVLRCSTNGETTIAWTLERISAG